MALSKFQETPVLELIEDLTCEVTIKDVESSFGRLMIVNQMFSSIEDLGKKFISPSATPLGNFFISYFLPNGRYGDHEITKMAAKTRSITERG